MKVVIIGGVAGGASAAARLRRLDENAEIVILEKSGYISYANCGLPYYIGGDITNRSNLTLQTPESFNARFRIDVRVKNEALSINREKKLVRVRELDSGKEYNESYDKLILSPGAKPFVPNIAGIDTNGVFTLRNVEDTFAIDDYIAKNAPKSAVVIGGGFIGLEMAESLKKRGMEVTIVEKADQVMPPLDRDMAAEVHSYIRSKGITLMLSTGANAFRVDSDHISVSTDKDELQSDMVLLSIGVVPDSSLAREAGLLLGVRGAIKTNSFMQTSDPDIYAVGDAVEVVNFVSGADSLVPLAGPANKQGRIAADNIAGKSSEYRGTQGSSVLKLFGLTIASTGLSERAAKAAGLDADFVIMTAASHATYYPGASNMQFKVVFEKGTGRILGASAVGRDGADKRVDVVATAIRGGMTAEDLAELELCYAPPYSSAKDPVNMAGFMIENILDGTVKQTHWRDIVPRFGNDDFYLLDTRTVREYEAEHIDCAHNIPLHELRSRLSELDPKKTIYIHCLSGLRSYIATRILTGNGFDAVNVSGGWRFYKLQSEDGMYDDTLVLNCGMPDTK